MIPSPPVDRALPGLATLLDGSAMRDRLAAALPDSRAGGVELLAAQPTYVRYKPATSCLVSYTLTIADCETGEQNQLPAHVRLYASGDVGRLWARSSLDRLLRRAARRHPRPLRARAGVLDDPPAVVQVFPVDRALPPLVRATDRSSAGRMLAQATVAGVEKLKVRGVELIRYRPARKALLRYRLAHASLTEAGDWVYAKLYADDRAARVDRQARRLRTAGIGVPAPLGASVADRLLVQAAAAGVPLHELRGQPGYAEAVAEAATLLSRMHRVALGHPGDIAAARPLAALLDQAVDGLATLVPEHAGRIRRLVAGLIDETQSVRSSSACLIHGDFYDDQLLVADHGLVMLDLDEVALGEPLIDAGNMLAHLSAKLVDEAAAAVAREGFLAAWDNPTPATRGLAPVLYESAALVLMAVGPFRRLEADWPGSIVRHVELAERRLTEYREARSRTGLRGTPGPVRPARGARIARGEASLLNLLVLPQPVRLRRAQVVRRKPGRRTTIRWDLEVGADRRRHVAYAKQFCSGRAPAVAAALGALSRASGEPPMPRLPVVLGCMPDDRLIVLDEVPGRPAVGRLVSGDVGMARAIADAICALHACGATLERRRTLDDEIVAACQRASRLADAEIELAPLVRRALDEIKPITRQRAWPWRDRPLHRDFYPDQVLVGDDRIGFLDLDDAAMGEPAIDIANFAAHLRLGALQAPERSATLSAVECAFVERALSTDLGLDRSLVQLLHAVTLLRLAHIHHRPGSRIARSVLDEVLRCLPAVTAG